MHELELGDSTAITITIFNCDTITIVRSTCILFVRILRASYTVYKVHPIKWFSMNYMYEVETVDKNIDYVNTE